MRTVLHQVWATLYVEFVVKNPLAPVEHSSAAGGKSGVGNELFEGGLESFMVCHRCSFSNCCAITRCLIALARIPGVTIFFHSA
jgi:hypothetical protein